MSSSPTTRSSASPASALQFRRAADRGECAGHLGARRDGRRAVSEPQTAGSGHCSAAFRSLIIPRTATRRNAAGCSSSPAAASLPAPLCSPESPAFAPAPASCRSPPPRASPPARRRRPRGAGDRLRGDRGGLPGTVRRSRLCWNWRRTPMAIAIGCGLAAWAAARRVCSTRCSPAGSTGRSCSMRPCSAALLRRADAAARPGRAARSSCRIRARWRGCSNASRKTWRPIPSPRPAGRRRAYGAVALIKGQYSHIAAPDGRTFRFEGGGVGLATSGSGDVLAGIVGGPLRARRRTAGRDSVGRLAPRRGGADPGRASRQDRLPRPRDSRSRSRPNGGPKSSLLRAGRARRRSGGRYG